MKMMLMFVGTVLMTTFADGAVWRLEAEEGDGGDTGNWVTSEQSGASGGAVLLMKQKGESGLIPFTIPAVGRYQVAIRYERTPGKPSNFACVIRDGQGRAVEMQRVDWHPVLRTARLKGSETPEKGEAGWDWAMFEVKLDGPMDVTFSLIPADGMAGKMPRVDCLVVSDEAGLRPETLKLSELTGKPPVNEGKRIFPEGMQAGLPLTYHSRFFSGAARLQDAFQLAFLPYGQLYADAPLLLELGANRNHQRYGGSPQHGIEIGVSPLGDEIALKEVPEGVGRFVNAEGKASRRFSYSYEPYRRAYMERLAGALGEASAQDGVRDWRVAAESGGFLDYGEASKEKFHRWLKDRYGKIATLNERWLKEYTDFTEVPLPRSAADGKAAWFAFREFCGLEYTSFVMEKVKVITKHDPEKRVPFTQLSNVHLLAPSFTSVFPLDYEDLIRGGLPEVGWDSYCVDDQLGAETDLLLSLAGDRPVINQEWNTHGHDPAVAGRTLWTMVGKGVRGVYSFTLWNSNLHWSYPMWGLTNPDFTPRGKLGALADAYHEIHRLEPLLMAGKPMAAVKPVALYYSRLDLSLPQPLLSVYGTPMNDPLRVYSVLRGLGYPVRWITPRQIEAGALDEVGAVVLLGTRHVPKEAAAKLSEWVRKGGAVIGDDWPGAYDEYGREQVVLADLFGVRAAPPKELSKDAMLAFQESVNTAYGDLTALELNKGDFSSNVVEMFDQWDSQHPVAKAVGAWHLSGYGRYPVDCVSGEAIGATFSTDPAVVINRPEKGYAMYVAAMLGTLYEGAPTPFEWDSMREGPAVGNLLDAFLRHAGLQPFSASSLPMRLARKTRVELPLVDAAGNALVGMTSLNDAPVQPHAVSMVWPETLATPRLVLQAVNGRRELVAIPFRRDEQGLTVDVQGYESHSMLLMLSESAPLVSLKVSGARRTVAGLLDVEPKEELVIKATVWNPSDRILPAGRMDLHLPEGWSCSAPILEVPEIEAFSSVEVMLKVAAPAVATKCSLRPMVIRYHAGDVQSTPATEMVWWGRGGGDY